MFVRTGLVIAAVFGFMAFIPSSGRASDFVKIGSPLSVPTQIYGMATIFDRNPAQFEAWAVGVDVSDPNPVNQKGVMLYYNGNFWSRVALPDLPPLRAISAQRFLKDGTAWTTVAWAVGDDGVMLRLDPYTKVWRVQQKYVQDELRCATPAGSSCTTLGSQCGTDNSGNALTCVNVRDMWCTDADVGSSKCGYWTSNDLTTVASASQGIAYVGGTNSTFLQHSETFPNGIQSSSWTNAGGPLTAANIDVTGLKLLDVDHSWAVGHDRVANVGKLWKFTRKTGWVAVTLSAANANGHKFTSVEATLRRTETTANAPLTSVVWIGAEDNDGAGSATNKIIRFDESTGGQSVSSVSSPIRSLALTRRAGGQGVNLTANGTFSADRQDANASGFIPDGWDGVVYYLNGLGNYVTATALVNGESGKAFVSEPWQNRGSFSAPASARGGQVVHWNLFGSESSNYPYETWYSLGTNFTTTLQETDITPLISRNSLINFSGATEPYLLSATVQGYLNIPNSLSASQTATIEIEHPMGRVAFYAENDTTTPQVCEGGVNTGLACSDDSGCPNSKCTDRTSYPTNPLVSYVSTATPNSGWTKGTCSNVTSPLSTVYCFDNRECNWGVCSDNPSKRCRYDGELFSSGCGTCLPLAGAPVCNGASNISSPTTMTVAYPANSGMKIRHCVGGSNANRACVSDEQCSAGGGTCQVAGSGWFPFMLRYYQLNTAYCSGIPNLPCLSTAECQSAAGTAGGTCVSGKWCQSGARIGQSCSVDGDCGGAAGSCIQQYPATNRCQINSAKACIGDGDCPNVGDQKDRCNIASAPAAPLKLKWNCDATGCGGGRPMVAIPAANLLNNQPNTNQRRVSQEIPLTVVDGVTYQVSGRYKVEFTKAFDTLSAGDPRRPVVSRAGIRTKCTNTSSTNDSCGYDLTNFTTTPAKGVTGGTCSGDGFACNTDLDCSSGGHGTTCNGNWVDFTATLTKQNRTNTGVRTSDVRVADYPAQGLNIECFADPGARISCDSITVTPVTDAAQAAFDQVDVWAVGDNGLAMRNSFNMLSGLPANDFLSWKVQTSPTTQHLRTVAAADSFHLWASGDHEIIENATIFRLSPGNVSGWAWIGTASSTANLDPIGWVDFNCGNIGTCLSQPTAFGVNVDTATASPTVGAFSGSAWLGSSDPNETIDFGACLNKPTGTCVGLSGVSCQDDSTCQAQGGTTCSFNTNCDNSSTNPTNTCYGAPGRYCTNSGQCYGACEKNQGFRCLRDSDCVVSCADNPAACKSSGWLSFDKTLTGTPPASAQFDTAQSFTAKLDLSTDAVSGWARFMLGRCTNASSPSTSSNRSCFLDAQCSATNPSETCDWTAAPSVPGTLTAGQAYSQAGWVKLRGDSMVPPNPSDYLSCSDCSDGTTPTNGTCKICAARIDPSRNFAYAPLACNTCGSCSANRCTSDGNPCLDDSTCGAGTCKPSGRCDFGEEQGGRVCFSNSDCNDSNCLFGAECNACGTCNTYGVSVDYNTTKNFVGYGYSPDLGWIDFSRVTLGGQLFFQTQFGDIYAGGNIGSAATGLPPGFPGSSTRCNATYRIVSAGTITNFCSFAQPSPPGSSTADPVTSPFISPGSEKLVIPSSGNQYTSSIGSIDRDGLVNVVTSTGSIDRNKFGNVVAEYGTDSSSTTTISSIFNCTGTGTCQAKLLGKIYHIIGNLRIDRDINFLTGANATATNPAESGAGTFIVDGELQVDGNMQYGLPSGFLASRVSLPSAAFIVKGDIDISQSVSVMSGVFYSEEDIRTGIGETSLTVSGVMVAKSFDFRRRFRGSGAGSQEAAELVIYDGRLQTNTPPGLAGLSEGLPSVQELVP